jgi:hypothetical protein
MVSVSTDRRRGCLAQMSTIPLVQTAAIDIGGWEADAEYAIYPQGARSKNAVFAPEEGAPPVVVPTRRYMFKRSRESYPDQFWAEVVAYRVGCLLGLTVPPAFAAIDSSTGECAALIEWFYVDGVERFVHAGEFLQALFPEFDRERGADHNMNDNGAMLRTLTLGGRLRDDWRPWWLEALVFDALIGNTDRHQDNWGLLFKMQDEPLTARLAPLFDNGTSLGSERFVERVKNWDEATLNRYVDRGTHHVRWNRDDDHTDRGHITLVARAVEKWPDKAETIAAKIHAISDDDLSRCLADLGKLDMPLRLSEDRQNFMLRLLSRRLRLLQAVLP